MSNREMLINYVPGEECRIAIVEDGRLEEIYQERPSAESHVGNIYKGKVLNVEPSIQAAFIDFGLPRNGFLHISDLHPKYFPGEAREEFERVGMKTPRRERPPIQKCLRRGQEILVQVLKEGIGTKGPTLTSYLSIPGRFLVMMPHMERLGVSRKVEDDEARHAMREILNELKPPEEFGFIIRTAGIGRTKLDLKRDLAYLQRLWKRIEQRMGETRVGELYTESDLLIRTIRDVFSSDITRILVDDRQAAQRASDFLAIASPRSGSQVLFYDDPVPLFHRFGIEKQIETINARVVPLPSGGSLVIDSTEALVAIDVNSGKSRETRDAEANAFHTNCEAADEICRQLRLRDLGGVVVNDFIDMRIIKNRRALEQRFRNNLKRDRARTRVGSISQFGILEMTRQRMRPSLKRSIYMDCPHCQASGEVKTTESVVLDVMRRLALTLGLPQVVRVELTVSPDVAFQLLNRKRAAMVELEKKNDKSVLVRVNAAGPIDYVHLAGFDGRGSAVDIEAAPIDTQPGLTPVESLPPQDDLLDEAEVEPTQDVEVQPVAPEEHEPAPESEATDSLEPTGEVQPQAQAASPGQTGQPAGRRRRRRRRRGRGGGGGAQGQVGAPPQIAPPQAPASAPEATPEPVSTGYQGNPPATVQPPTGVSDQPQPGQDGGRRRRRRRRGGRRHRRRHGQAAPGQESDSQTAPTVQVAPAPPPTP